MGGTVKKPRPEIELQPDAWERFDRFVRDIAKGGPQHRTASKPKANRAKSPERKRRSASKN
jgi:hypothetical protein